MKDFDYVALTERVHISDWIIISSHLPDFANLRLKSDLATERIPPLSLMEMVDWKR
jgi:hypothetical protein